MGQPSGTYSPQGSPSPSAAKFAQPDLYELSDGDIDVAYLPISAGGQPHLTYRDSQRAFNFRVDQIRRVELPDLGTMVSITLVMTVDSDSTTFSVLIPHVNLPDQRGSSAFIRTKGITTVHRLSLVSVLNQGQREVYTVTPLSGTTSLVIIPL